MKTRISFGFAVLMVFVLVLPQLAMAAGTDTNFNTTITNNVTIQYGSGPSTITTSTSVDFVVDRVLDWVVAPTVATTLDVFENTTGNAVAFSVRNDTNGPVDILLSLAELTDTPAAVGLFADTNTNGTYEAGTDLALPTSGADWYIDEVAEDAAPTFFVVVDVAAGAATTDVYDYEIDTTTYEAGAAGLGADLIDHSADADQAATVQNVFNDGAGYNDAAQDESYTAYVAFRVAFANLTVTKTAVVTSDPVNGASNPKAIPGATVHYTITVTNIGTTAATSVDLSDAIPANTTYVAASLTVTGGGGAVADDSGDPLTVTGGTITGGSTMTVEFDVTID
jgi:uncharacterized repeat protein (TIGR01451 family)